MGTAFVVTAAATLMESAPFVIAAAVLLALPLRLGSRMAPYLGCGCGTGPSARSIPAAAATLLVFGPFVALARLAAAIAVQRLRHPSGDCGTHGSSLLAQLAALVPIALGAAAVSLFAPALIGAHPPAVPAFLGAAILGFVMAPCGIGAVAIAASARVAAPAAAAGFLCVAGIADLRTWMHSPHEAARHDGFAYLLAAAAFALAAAHGGAGLVNPRFTPALWICAAAALAWGCRYRDRRDAKLRVAPALMLAGSILAAPPPVYHATETSLGQAFAGERLEFTGQATQTGSATTLVRYAITCCRADAAPLVVRLDRRMRSLRGWYRAKGVLQSSGGNLVLHAQQLQGIPAPADPFVYR